MKAIDRRTFIEALCLAACAGMARPASASATFGSSSDRRRLVQPLFFSNAERAVVDFVSSYAKSIHLIGGGVLSRLRGQAAADLHLLVEIENLDRFVAAMAGPRPFKSAYAEANKLSFVVERTACTIENLVSPAFVERIAQVGRGGNVRFALDALWSEPGNGLRFDSLGAVASHSSTSPEVETELAGTDRPFLSGHTTLRPSIFPGA